MSNEERIECIRSAGIVGHGGATFPTHVKIQSGIGKCDTVIINAAECEPYITSDHRLLLERPEETIGGLKMLADIMGVQTAIIAIEENKKDTFAKIEELIAQRAAAKKAKDFAEADRIRGVLADMGVTIKDTRQGTQWSRS